MAVTALGALLGIVTLLGGFASSRLHGAYREALRDLRESERRLDAREAGHVDGRLEPELRWLAEIRDADRDARWRESALVMALLGAAAVALAIWTLVSGVRAVEAFAVIALAAAAVLVTVLLALDGQRVGRTLVATTRQARLWGLLRLENALSDVQRATVRRHAAHRAWLRSSAARQPLAGLVARWRERRFQRAEARRQRAVDRLPTPSSAAGVLDQLRGAGVRAPVGYVDGVRGLLPLVGRGAPRLEDDADWDATLADLTRAVEQDAPRRLRWLAALAACAELRDDPVARESAARWALDMAALGPADARAAAADRYDPLPDAALVEPVSPTTWAGAVRRARETGAPASVLASVLVRWAYALVLAQADGRPDGPAGGRPDGPAGGRSDGPADRRSGGPADGRGVDAAIAPAVDAGVEIMQALPERESDRYLRLVRAGLSELGASGAQMSRLVPPRAVPAAAPPEPSDEPTVVLPGTGASPPEPVGFPREPGVQPHDLPSSSYDPAPPAPRTGDQRAESLPAAGRPTGGATVADGDVTAVRPSGGATAVDQPRDTD